MLIERVPFEALEDFFNSLSRPLKCFCEKINHFINLQRLHTCIQMFVYIADVILPDKKEEVSLLQRIPNVV